MPHYDDVIANRLAGKIPADWVVPANLRREGNEEDRRIDSGSRALDRSARSTGGHQEHQEAESALLDQERDVT